MAPRSLSVVAALFFMGVAMHGAQGQLLGLLGLIRGTVPCTAGSAVNASMAPAFPNAGVQVVCGGNVIAGTTANSKGEFSVSLGLTGGLLAVLMGGDCTLVVTTPLAACNVTVPSAGVLAAPLQLLGQSGGLIGGLLGGGVLNFGPSLFSFLPKLA